jgi:hypothetical protein
MTRFVIAMIAGIAAAAAFAGTAFAGSGAPQYTDQQILDAAYDGPRVYAGGYSETLPAGVSLYYVRALQGGTLVERCSDDMAEARGWAAELNAESSTPRTASAERVTQKFFEFRYDGAGHALLVRVHRCSYANPSGGLTQALQSGAWGDYNGSLSAKAVREFAEYEWFIRNNGWLLRSLLSSERSSGPGYDEVRLYFAAVLDNTFNEQGAPCDVVGLIEQTVHIERSSRDVTMSFQTLRTLQGHCEPVPGA